MPRYLPCNAPVVRELRLARGWTQDDLARHADYSRRLVQKAESGGSLSPATIAVLAEALSTDQREVQVADLLRTPLSIVQEFLGILQANETETGPKAAHLIADDFEMWCAGDRNVIPFAGAWRGLDGLTEFFQRFFSMLEPAPDGMLKKTQFMTNGSIVSCWAESHAGVRGMAEDPPPIWNTMRFEVREDKIVRYDNLFDTQTGAEHLAEARAQRLLDEHWTPEAES